MYSTKLGNTTKFADDDNKKLWEAWFICHSQSEKNMEKLEENSP